MSETFTESAVDDTVDPGDGAEVETSPESGTAETDVVETSAPEPATAPAIDWNDPLVQQQLAPLVQQQTIGLLEQLGVLGYEDSTPSPPDPLSDNYAAEQAAYTKSVIEQALAPMQQYIAAQQAQETNTVIGGALTEAAKAAGVEGVDAALLRSVASHFAAQPEYARLGATEAGVRATAKAAADWIASDRKAAGEAAVQAYKESFGKDSNLLDPKVNGTGVERGREFSDELDLARNFSFNRA